MAVKKNTKKQPKASKKSKTPKKTLNKALKKAPKKIVKKVAKKEKKPVKATKKAAKTSPKKVVKKSSKIATPKVKTPKETVKKTEKKRVSVAKEPQRKTKILSFKIGQKIFHFWYGAGEITGKRKEVINNEKKKYFVLEFNANDVIYLVPEDRMGKINIRSISKASQLDEAVKSLAKNTFKTMNFKQIEAECQENISSGDLIAIASVIKIVYRHRKKQEKLGKISPLSTSFEKLLRTAKRLFASEWAVLKKLNYETCLQKINKIIEDNITA